MKKIICLILIFSFSYLPIFAVGICEEKAYSSYEASEQSAASGYAMILAHGNAIEIAVAGSALSQELNSALNHLQENLAVCTQGDALINNQKVTK
jgi:hypothetical protein